MAQLAADKALRRRMSAAARTTAMDHSWSRMGTQYLALFRERCTPPRKQPALATVAV
jgi:hypothetical protein